MIIRPSLPGKSVRSFEKSGVTFASLDSIRAAPLDSFADECAAVSRNEKAPKPTPQRSRATAVANFPERLGAGTDCRSLGFCEVLRLSHSPKLIRPIRGRESGTRL